MNVAITDSLVKVQMNIVPKDDIVVLTVTKNSNRNLLLRSVAFDAINKSLVIPAQEFKDIQQQISNARKLKICSATISEFTRQNPDSSTGLYLNSELRAKARIVSNAKKRHNENEVKKKLATAKNKMKLDSKRKASFEKLKATI